MGEYTRQLPVVALRNMTVLPGMLIHFDVNRKFSILAVDKAMQSDQQVFLIAQKDSEADEPELYQLYQAGTIAVIKQMIKLPGGVVRVLVSGTERAQLTNIISYQPFYLGEVTAFEEEEPELSDFEKEAMVRSLRDILEAYTSENSKLSKDTIKQLLAIEDVVKLVDQLAVHLPMALAEKQEILEENTFLGRFQRTAVVLQNEIEIMRIKKELQGKVKDRVDKNQKEYILREQLKVIREELGETNTGAEADSYLEMLDKLQTDDITKDKIRKEIERFRNMGGSTSEGAVARGYVETLLELPWDKAGEDTLDIVHAKKVLDEDHYGLQKVKERMLEFLAVRTLTKKGDSPIICLVGPPGTGKTSIARSVAKALDKKYVRICLGGVRDEAEIRGHRRTYISALPGRIISGLKSAEVKNPLMLLDEIDKVSSDYKGDTSSALLEVLDSEQNNRFVDHYVEIPVDLSEVLFIATANSIQTIPRPLLDRMEIIEVNSYSQNEKLHIAKEHLVAKQIERNGLLKKQINFTAKALDKMIRSYTKEAGVRNLERRLGEVCRKVAKELLEYKELDKIKITDKNLKKYLGNEKYTYTMANTKDEIGVVRGLAWTNVGGDTLQIEVNTMNGKGHFELTGQLGDVMKESAKAGISYFRSVAEQYHIEDEYFEKHDIHIHIPEGAVPKDGPSAGITMATAIISAVTGRKVHADLAMTGEITLRGRVLPIGGLKEKILAAKSAGIKRVLVPEKNKPDILELEQEIKEGIEIQFVDQMEEVLKAAFV